MLNQLVCVCVCVGSLLAPCDSSSLPPLFLQYFVERVYMKKKTESTEACLHTSFCFLAFLLSVDVQLVLVPFVGIMIIIIIIMARSILILRERERESAKCDDWRSGGVTAGFFFFERPTGDT